ncbi:uncharacterized protein SCHCODRAFT_02714309 [Schizophyllum commune H4-8]|uniref:uncharacterized protein n=1 Tax=Schizophyllum commune (strain H4-8 / FGSC 9210) TaxID=578458 RepID=UPI00215F2046|nr:uncharacterized protein SCHCODRAFT_02714309 [Schizophyllum commune H4-8]KAI5888017.1 hypothetical protein SCHCODRAFT_02714309 [Schizophyllum commune H4-8]
MAHGAVRKSNLPRTADKRTFTALPGTHMWSVRRPPIDVRTLAQPAPPPVPAARPPVEDEHIDAEGLRKAKPRCGKAKVDTAKAYEEFFGHDDNAVILREIDNGTFDLHYLAASTLSNYDYIERVWLEAMTVILKSEKLAALTLQEGQALPEEGTMKTFFEFVGRTRGPDGRGLSYNTMVKFQGAVFGMLYSRGVASPTPAYREAIKNFIDALAKVKGVIEDRAREKLLMREVDLLKMLKALLDPGLSYDSNKTRVTMYFLTTIMSELGTRIGTWTEAENAQGLAQCVRWGDTTVYIEGTDSWGLNVSIFFRLHWLKGYKGTSLRISDKSIRVLPGSEAHMDPILPFLVIGCYYDVWEQSNEVIGWISGAVAPPASRVELVVRDKFKHTGVVRASKQPSEEKLAAANTDNQPEMYVGKNRKPQEWKTMSSASANHFVQKIAVFCGILAFMWKFMRYTFGENLKRTVSPDIVTAAMGHRINSPLTWTTYKAQIAQVDFQARFRGRAEDTSTIEFYNSVGRTAGPASADSLHEDRVRRLFADAKVEELARTFDKLDHAVYEKYGKWVDEVPDMEKPDELVEEARDAMNDILIALRDLNNKILPPAASTAPEPVDGAPRSATLARFVHSLDAGHPYLSLVTGENALHARANVFKALMHLLRLDEQALQRQCFLCAREGIHKDLLGNYGQHMWTCMQRHYKDTHTRCNFCAGFFGNGDELDKHCRICYADMIAAKNLDIQDAEDAGRPLGIDSYKHQFETEYKNRTVYYCPVCINDFDEEDPNACGVNDPGKKEMLRHMLSHCKTTTAPKFDSSVSLRCKMWTCRENATMYDFADMIAHWHNTHGYDLLRCVDARPGHDHAQDTSLSLRESIDLSSKVPVAKDKIVLYEEDVSLLRAALAGKVQGEAADVAYVCLQTDCRKADARKRTRLLIEKV